MTLPTATKGQPLAAPGRLQRPGLWTRREPQKLVRPLLALLGRMAAQVQVQVLVQLVEAVAAVAAAARSWATSPT